MPSQSNFKLPLHFIYLIKHHVIFCPLALDPLTHIIIKMTSWWTRWPLKSHASRLFTQPFIRSQINENIKAPRYWPNSPHKWPVTRKMFSFDDVIMVTILVDSLSYRTLGFPKVCTRVSCFTFHNHLRLLRIIINWIIRCPTRVKFGVILGPDSIKRRHLSNIGNPIVEIRRS